MLRSKVDLIPVALLPVMVYVTTLVNIWLGLGIALLTALSMTLTCYSMLWQKQLAEQRVRDIVKAWSLVESHRVRQLAAHGEDNKEMRF